MKIVSGSFCPNPVVSWGCILYSTLPRPAIFTLCQVEVIASSKTLCIPMYTKHPLCAAVLNVCSMCARCLCALLISCWGEVILGRNLFIYISVVWIMHSVGTWWLLTHFTSLSFHENGWKPLVFFFCCTSYSSSQYQTAIMFWGLESIRFYSYQYCQPYSLLLQVFTDAFIISSGSSTTCFLRATVIGQDTCTFTVLKGGGGIYQQTLSDAVNSTFTIFGW